MNIGYFRSSESIGSAGGTWILMLGKNGVDRIESILLLTWLELFATCFRQVTASCSWIWAWSKSWFAVFNCLIADPKVLLTKSLMLLKTASLSLPAKEKRMRINTGSARRTCKSK